MRYRKIDAHNHLLGAASNPEVLLRAADQFDIELTVISIPVLGNATPKEFRANNQRVLKAIRAHPDRLLGQCFVDPRYRQESLAEIDRCLDLGMIGVGELYTSAKISEPVFFPIIEKCIERRVPLTMHARADVGLLRPGVPTSAPPSSSTPDDMVMAARRYPEAMLIEGHLGGGGDWEYACKVLAAVANVYLETAGSVTDSGMVDFAVRCLGVERILFATDMSYETGIGKVMAAELTEAQRRRIFRDNFAAILRQGGHHAH